MWLIDHNFGESPCHGLISTQKIKSSPPPPRRHRAWVRTRLIKYPSVLKVPKWNGCSNAPGMVSARTRLRVLQAAEILLPGVTPTVVVLVAYFLWEFYSMESIWASFPQRVFALIILPLIAIGLPLVSVPITRDHLREVREDLRILQRSLALLKAPTQRSTLRNSGLRSVRLKISFLGPFWRFLISTSFCRARFRSSQRNYRLRYYIEFQFGQFAGA